MANQAAWLMEKQAHPLKVDAAPMPQPFAHEIIIKTHAVAINPVDAGIQQMGILVQKYPAVVGCDIAGEVTALGSDVKNFKVGDRVIACVDVGADRPNTGTFQLYCAVEEALTTKLPDNVSYTDGCVLPLGLCTAAVSLFQHDTLALDFPELAPQPKGKLLVIFGASSSVGSCAIQMAKAAGYEVAAICGAHNFEYCRGLGAAHVFDHKKESLVDDVVKALKGKESAGVFDAVMPPDTMLKSALIADGLGGNKFVCTIVPPPAMQPIAFPMPENAPESVKFGYCNGAGLRSNEVGPAILGRWLSPALANGSMQCKPSADIVGTGLGAVQEALDKMSAGVSAKKLVVKML